MYMQKMWKRAKNKVENVGKKAGINVTSYMDGKRFFRPPKDILLGLEMPFEKIYLLKV